MAHCRVVLRLAISIARWAMAGKWGKPIFCPVVRAFAPHCVWTCLHYVVATEHLTVASQVSPCAIRQQVSGDILEHRSCSFQFRRRREDTTLRRPTTVLLSMGLVFLLIFTLVPWQVAFLGCWLIHFYTCASSLAELSSVPSPTQPGADAIPLVRTLSNDRPNNAPADEPKSTAPIRLALPQQVDGHLHILLFMTWLLPLVAPVLAVWVRTLATAGITTPFDGDHNFLYVVPFLVLVEVFGGGTTGQGVKKFL